MISKVVKTRARTLHANSLDLGLWSKSTWPRTIGDKVHRREKWSHEPLVLRGLKVGVKCLIFISRCILTNILRPSFTKTSSWRVKTLPQIRHVNLCTK